MKKNTQRFSILHKITDASVAGTRSEPKYDIQGVHTAPGRLNRATRRRRKAAFHISDLKCGAGRTSLLVLAADRWVLGPRDLPAPAAPGSHTELYLLCPWTAEQNMRSEGFSFKPENTYVTHKTSKKKSLTEQT